MKLVLYIAFIILLIFFETYCQSSEKEISANKYKEWVVRVLGGQRAAKSLAKELGYFFKGPVRNFRNTYVLLEVEHLTHDKRGRETEKTKISEDARVMWAEEQVAKKRDKRDSTRLELLPILFKNLYTESSDESETGGRFSKQKIVDRTFNDNLWPQEWYMQDTRTKPDLPKLDLNVLPVYKAGITGKGVRVTILDDGIERTHEDLKENYDPAISWDCNEDDADPMPRYDTKQRNSHGTRCAGEVAMAANNGKCGVGIAFNARIGGVKLLDGYVNDRIEGMALGFAYDLVDIYSASWGPSDDGQTLDGPGTLAQEALLRGITEGRGGKGAIYVWASGNGGNRGDNCNCDGYLASPFTISISSASQRGEFPWYGEACASTLAVTYSSGAYRDQMITTTDLHNQCTDAHTGTSASAPLAAGIIALALEANPYLTWRDVQHLIVWSSEMAPVSNGSGWQINDAGLWFNTKFGFGLMNAHGLVSLAVNWTTVPRKCVCVVDNLPILYNRVSLERPVHVYFHSTSCQGTRHQIGYLEHVEITVNIEYPLRGVLEIFLISPAGTKVQLLGPRVYDDSEDGFQNWKFMSVMTWGENPYGKWILEIGDIQNPRGRIGFLGTFSLTLHGTKKMPDHMKSGPRNYNLKYNSERNELLRRIDQKENVIFDLTI